MNKIVDKKFFSENVVKMVIESPDIARNRKPGHFVIVKTGKKGERIPLTIAGADPEKGTIDLVIQIVGVTSHKITSLEVGDEITDISGPLGMATHIEKVGTVLAAAGGVGTAPLLPIIEAMKKGAADYLQKPINMEELLIRLQKIQNFKSLLKNASDLREAMQVTEQTSSETIQNLEIMVSELEDRLEQMRSILEDQDLEAEDRIQRALAC